MVIDEKALLDRARAFDLEALGSIYDLYQPALYRDDDEEDHDDDEDEEDDD